MANKSILCTAVFFFLFCSVASLCATTLLIAKHDVNTFKRQRDSTIFAPKITYNKYRHIVIFCALGVYLYTVVIAERFNWTRIIDDATTLGTAWAECRVAAFSQMTNEDACIRPYFGSDSNFELFFHFTCGTLGLCIALMTVIETEFIVFAKQKIIYILSCGKKVPQKYTDSTSASSSNSRKTTFVAPPKNVDKGEDNYPRKSTAVLLDDRSTASIQTVESEEKESLSASANKEADEGQQNIELTVAAEKLKSSLEQ